MKWTYPFAGYGFIFCLGAFIDRIVEHEKVCKVVIVLSPFCLAINTALMAHGFEVGVCDISPFFCLFSVGFYCVIIKLSSRIDFSRRENLTRCIGYIARYSFYVYMAHVFMLRLLLKYFLGYSGVVTVFLQICASLLILLTSLLFAIVAKKFVVSPMQKGFDLLFDLKR